MVSAVGTMDVARRAQSALCSSPIHVLQKIQVEQSGNALHLLGRVDTYYHKQLAQETVRAVANGMAIENSVRVD